jgi:hypothetical protein
MRKITDDGYILPIIEALSPHELFESGANKPLLITGVDANGIKGDYVVKFRSSERMSFEASMRELLAAFIAMQMEITVVRPVIVNVSQDFANLLREHEACNMQIEVLVINYGHAYY